MSDCDIDFENDLFTLNLDILNNYPDDPKDFVTVNTALLGKAFENMPLDMFGCFSVFYMHYAKQSPNYQDRKPIHVNAEELKQYCKESVPHIRNGLKYLLKHKFIFKNEEGKYYVDESCV